VWCTKFCVLLLLVGHQFLQIIICLGLLLCMVHHSSLSNCLSLGINLLWMLIISLWALVIVSRVTILCWALIFVGYYCLLGTNFRGLLLFVGHQFVWVTIVCWALIFVGYHCLLGTNLYGLLLFAGH